MQFRRPDDWPRTHRFFETGTCRGDSLRAAARSGDYQELISVEFDALAYASDVHDLLGAPDVVLVYGSSPDVIGVLADTHKDTTFWLDAHFSGVGTTCDQRYGQCPLLAELDAIIGLSNESDGWKPWIAIDDAFLFDPQAWHDGGRGLFDTSVFIRQQWPTLDQIRARLIGYDVTTDGMIVYCRPVL